MPHNALFEHYAALEQVVTVAEAARLTFSSRNTILYAIWAENIAARKCGGVWLVSVPSLKIWNDNRLGKTA